MRILACSLILVVSGSAADLAAQPISHTDSRGSIAGVFGGGRTWDDEGSLGAGPVVGGRVQWRLFGTTSVEASVDALSHDRRGGFFEAEGRTLFLGATLLHRFIGDESMRAQFYVLGGLHVAKHSGSTTFDVVRRGHASADPGYHFGGGVAIRVGERVELGPEARFYMMQAGNDSDPGMAYWVGGRLGVQF
jgi:hypothetical protein